MIHDEVMSWVMSEIVGVTHFSFTTDAWSGSIGGCSLLSLTAHWLTELFAKRSAVIHVQPLQDSHTGEYLGVVYKRLDYYLFTRQKQLTCLTVKIPYRMHSNLNTTSR